MLANFSNLITFSRGSNATLTDASGRLTYAPNNLVTNSQDFEASAWATVNAIIPAPTKASFNSAAAPDGTITADVISYPAVTGATNTSAIRQTVTLAAGFHIGSIYLKANTPADIGKRIAIYLLDAVDFTVAFYTLTNDWTRVHVVRNCAAGSVSLNVGVLGSSIGGVNQGAVSVNVWGAQLEAVTYQTTPSPYVSTSVANLLGFSEAFDNAAWTKTNAAIVTGVAKNPVNSLWNAQKLMETTAASTVHQVSQIYSGAVANGVYTFSVYLAKETRDKAVVIVSDNATGDCRVVVDLTAGTVGSPTISGNWTAASATIQAALNGFFRVSITCTKSSSGNANVVPVVGLYTTSATYTGDGNSGIYIYGAQLSNSGSLDPYVPTPGAAPSSTAYYGPRYDYDPVTLAAKGILIEEARTNLCTYSEQFDNANWTKDLSAITANAAVSPDNTANADLWYPTTSGNTSTIRIVRSISVTNGTVYTASVYAKSSGRRWVYFAAPDASSSAYNCWFDLQNGVVGTKGASVTAASITPVGNGWYRLTTTSTATSALNYMFISSTDADNSSTVTASGTSGILLYGAQLEAGAFATSYIPTVASQVTRNADVASITGSLFSQWFNGNEGTLLVKFDVASVGSGSSGMGIAALGTASTNGYLLYKGLGVPGLFAYTDGNSASLGNLSANVEAKAAVTYNGVSNAGVFNGSSPVSITTTAVTAPNRMSIGFSAGAQSTGHIQNITYYPNRLPNDQLQAITK